LSDRRKHTPRQKRTASRKIAEAQHQAKPEAKGSEADGTKPPKRPRVKLPAPVRTVNASGSIWLSSREPKRTQTPPNPPTWFPRELWAGACVILDDAIEEFPDREQLPGLCKRYISKMTPLYCEAVKRGKIKAHAVLQEDLGGMLDLLHSLLVHNDDGPHGGFESLSREARQIYEAARNSVEFKELRKAIAGLPAEMQHNGTVEALRTGEKQAESSSVQNNAKTARDVESNSGPGLELRAEKAQGVAEDFSLALRPREISSLVNFSLPAGSTHAELIQEIAKQLDWRVENPLPEHLREFSFPRGRTVFDPADKVLNDIVETHGLYWIVEDGALRFTASPLTTEASAGKKGPARNVGMFSHSPDYRSVTVRGETYTLTSEQAGMIKILHEARESGNPEVSIAYIMEQLEKQSSRWQDTFKSNPKAKKALVESGARKGTLRLNP